MSARLLDTQNVLERAEQDLGALRDVHKGALKEAKAARGEAEEARQAATAAVAEAAKLRGQAGALVERVRGAEAAAAGVQEANRWVGARVLRRWRGTGAPLGVCFWPYEREWEDLPSLPLSSPSFSYPPSHIHANVPTLLHSSFPPALPAVSSPHLLSLSRAESSTAAASRAQALLKEAQMQYDEAMGELLGCRLRIEELEKHVGGVGSWGQGLGGPCTDSHMPVHVRSSPLLPDNPPMKPRCST